MANFTTTPNSGVNFEFFDIDDLVGGYLFLASPTTWRTGPSAIDPGTHVDIQGVGFTYSGGALTGGTINSITSYSAGGFDFQITGLSMSAGTFNAFQASGDSFGFLETIFSAADKITGSHVDDALYGFAGADTLDGSDGDDELNGGTGDDKLIGGKGDDLYVIDSVGDVIVETGGGIDAVESSIAVDLRSKAFDGIENVYLDGIGSLAASGDASANEIWGNDGNNTLNGDFGNDKLVGRDGNDTLDGGAGADVMYGGAGNDTYIVDNALDKATEVFPIWGDAGGIDTVISSTKSFTLENYVENLTLTGAALNGTGNALANILIGDAHANILDGKGDADAMIGGDGNDTYYVQNAKDVVTETATGGTADAVHSALLAYTLPDNVEKLYLDGNTGTSGTGNSLSNWIYGNSGANTLDGGAGNDFLFGGAGNDTLIGGTGSNHLYGGSGNDTYDVSLGDNRVFYNSKLDGYDVIQGFDGDATGGQAL